MALNPKQAAFVSEFLTDFNATATATRAGYSAKTAKAMAWENLSKPEIAEAIRRSFDKRANELGITASRVLTEIATLAFAGPGSDVCHRDKLKALELLAKHFGLLTERVEVTVADDFLERLQRGRARLSNGFISGKPN